jgi:hypothetical protein
MSAVFDEERPHFEVRHQRCVESKLQNGRSTVKNTTIFISYEWVVLEKDGEDQLDRSCEK